MGRRRTGTVYEKDGALWFSIPLRSGKRHTRRVPPLPDGRVATKAQAVTYKDEALRRYELGLWDPEAPNPHAPREPAPAPKVYRVEEYGERWCGAMTHDSKFNEELFVRRHVKGTDLGRMPMPDVQPQHVLAWARALALKPSGHTSGGALAPKSVRAFYGSLKRLFNAAVFERVIASTPCVLPPGSLPKGTDKVPGARRRWRSTRDEVELLISHVAIPVHRLVLWAILYCAGLRAGEAFTLRWRDWDPRRRPLGCLTVERAWSSRHKKEKETKTEASREVPVHPTLAAILAEWKLSGWEKQYGRKPKPDDLVVPNRALEQRNTKNTAASLTTDCRAAGVTRRRLHGMRHTFISLAIDDGARPDIVAKITHTRPVVTAFDAYREEAWETLCAEVAKLKVRRIEALPLWKVASSSGGAATDSATHSTTPRTSADGNSMQEGTSVRGTSDVLNERDARDSHENAGVQASPAREPRSNPAQSATFDTDSATGSATRGTTSGPLSGELWAQDWFERSLLAETNDRGEIPDAGEVEP